MIQAYRSVMIDIDVDDHPFQVEVPLTIGLMRRIEQVLELAERNRSFFRIGRQKSLLDAYQEFCDPYLPATLDRDRLQPAFFAVFFSRVSGELTDSLRESVTSTDSTGGSPEPTDAGTTEE